MFILSSLQIEPLETTSDSSKNGQKGPPESTCSYFCSHKSFSKGSLQPKWPASLNGNPAAFNTGKKNSSYCKRGHEKHGRAIYSPDFLWIDERLNLTLWTEKIKLFIFLMPHAAIWWSSRQRGDCHGNHFTNHHADLSTGQKGHWASQNSGLL